MSHGPITAPPSQEMFAEHISQPGFSGSCADRFIAQVSSLSVASGCIAATMLCATVCAKTVVR
ncbi:hypothetical protein [Rahnella sp. CJA17(1/100)]|uniref:hypothetical protein n=1 Tax=Rahnella sp. CJA17(1/100) TaxID=2508951 RepID=UPI000A8FF059|nr:hypothetical protein [Rahnella sp. CJA17(1/100)]